MHKNKTDKDLTEAEEIKKRGQEYTEELYKKDLMVVWSIITMWSLTWSQTSWSMKSSEPQKRSYGGVIHHNCVISHLEPDILEYEVKWAFGSITMNKASGDDGILAELFQILKDDTSKFGKLSSGHRTRKGQFSFQF